MTQRRREGEGPELCSSCYLETHHRGMCVLFSIDLSVYALEQGEEITSYFGANMSFTNALTHLQEGMFCNFVSPVVFTPFST